MTKQIPALIEAVIFDMDGTLVNTEPVHCAAWLDILHRRGFHYDEAWFQQWVGKADRFVAQSVIAEHQLDLVPRVLQLEKEALFHQRVSTQNWAYPGLEDCLADLHARLPLAIATNSGRLDAEHVFRSTPLDRFMRTVVTADDVEILKPHPEMYLLAAERLGVNPANCLVIEDSPSGSEAAFVAGMYVLGVTSSRPRHLMTAVHEWFDTPLAAMERVCALTA